jgi:GT2 family glycosyltransferase
LVEEIGYYDENFYPAYFEDNDYAIRVHYSNYEARHLDNTPLIHGNVDGSKVYKRCEYIFYENES